MIMQQNEELKVFFKKKGIVLFNLVGVKLCSFQPVFSSLTPLKTADFVK